MSEKKYIVLDEFFTFIDTSAIILRNSETRRSIDIVMNKYESDILAIAKDQIDNKEQEVLPMYLLLEELGLKAEKCLITCGKKESLNLTLVFKDEKTSKEVEIKPPFYYGLAEARLLECKIVMPEEEFLKKSIIIPFSVDGGPLDFREEEIPLIETKVLIAIKEKYISDESKLEILEKIQKELEKRGEGNSKLTD